MDPAVLEIIRTQREKAKNRKRRPPGVSTWTHRERYTDGIIDSFNVVLVTRGCRWYHASGCSMCGYSNDCDISGEDLKMDTQLEEVERSYGGQPLIKVFTSGSFFDDAEITPEERQRVLDSTKGFLKKSGGTLIVESRPQFITKEELETAKATLGDIELTVAIGLESSNDGVLKECINKGFTFDDYKGAASLIVEAGAKLKTYLMLKPPFLSEADAVKDCIRSIRDLSDLEFPQTISMNPMNVQNYTLVEYLHHRGEYRPPWLWSVVEVLKEGRKVLGDGSWLLCHPTAGGKSRGPHNCGDCDTRFLEAIQDFSLTNGLDALDGLVCKCEKNYRSFLIEYK